MQVKGLIIKYFNDIFIVFPSIKRLPLSWYNCFTATYNRKINFYTVHYESLSTVSNFIHLRFINYFKIFVIVAYHNYCYNRLIA